MYVVTMRGILFLKWGTLEILRVAFAIGFICSWWRGYIVYLARSIHHNIKAVALQSAAPVEYSNINNPLKNKANIINITLKIYQLIKLKRYGRQQ